MSELFSISTLARKWNIPPRRISDLFYARKLSEDRCPIVANRRVIPGAYVPTIETVLRERGVLKQDPAQ